MDHRMCKIKVLNLSIYLRRIAPAFFACAIGFCQQPPYTQTLTHNGTTVRLTVERVGPSQSPADPLREGEPVVVRFGLSDAATNSPLAGASPAAWIDAKRSGEKTPPELCAKKIRLFAEGSVFSRTELDLTVFYVVIMNADATLTVVDPRFGHGDTRLLALVPLESPGEDWALTPDGKRLFVSLPDANKVAAIDTASWKGIGSAAIPHAARLAMQPDGAYLWTGYDSGVAVVSTRDMKIVARIPTGNGYHHMAFSPDSSFVFVTNPNDGTVSVIDVRKLSRTKDILVGKRPVWIAFSDLAKAAYVANEGDGTVVAIDAKEHRVVARMEAAPGLGQIKIAPGGRFGLVLNPGNDHVYVVDTSSNRIVQQGKLEKEPDQISFTNKQAHIRHRRSDSVLMIALDSLGREGAPISVADFTGGRHAPGAMSRPTPADGIVQASGESGVLVVNPGDKSIYYYMEGMAAPMGNFSNYGREPRAVLVVERNLREKSPGIYETIAKLPAAGSYDLAFLFDRPRILGCFDLPVASDPTQAKLRPPALKVEPRIPRSMKAGEPVRISFRLTFVDTGKPDTEAKDVTILAIAAGQWQRREAAQHTGDGVYSADFVVPKPGLYTVFLTSPSQGLPYAQYATVEVNDPSVRNNVKTK
jgi:YVTN family beta-propeller protein